MMKKATILIPALAVVAAASVALPAAAQSRGHGPSNQGPAYGQHIPGWQSISQRKYTLDRRIDMGVRHRQLSQRDAVRLKSELNSLVRLEASYMRGGLTLRERRELDSRYDRLAVRIDRELNTRGRPGYRR